MNISEFEAVYNEYKNMVHNLALNYVQNTQDAEDITQDTFVKVYRGLEKYDPGTASLKTWIYRIAINQSLDFIKARKTGKRQGFLISLFHKESNEPIEQAQSFDHPGIAL